MSCFLYYFLGMEKVLHSENFLDMEPGCGEPVFISFPRDCVSGVWCEGRAY